MLLSKVLPKGKNSNSWNILHQESRPNQTALLKELSNLAKIYCDLLKNKVLLTTKELLGVSLAPRVMFMVWEWLRKKLVTVAFPMLWYCKTTLSSLRRKCVYLTILLSYWSRSFYAGSICVKALYRNGVDFFFLKVIGYKNMHCAIVVSFVILEDRLARKLLLFAKALNFPTHFNMSSPTS